MRIKNWTKLSSKDLWLAWRAEFESKEDAEATAVWIANRLVKAHARSTRRKFYEVKDLFLSRYQSSLVEGQIVRNETRQCFRCADGSCGRCEDGVYSERTLYCHRFVIANTRYSFHSYQRPSSISDVPGEDKESYGGRFTDAEIRALRLPCTAIVRMMRFHAFSGWSDRPPEPLQCACVKWPGPRAANDHHEYCRQVGVVESLDGFYVNAI